MKNTDQKIVSYRIDSDLAREFKIACARAGVTGTAVVEAALKTFIERSKINAKKKSK